MRAQPVSMLTNSASAEKSSAADQVRENEVLPVGRKVLVRVPATSANLGPGFDSLGMALNWADETLVQTIDSGYQVEISGEGENFLPRDQSHLVVNVVRETLRGWSLMEPGLRLRVHNTIPIGKGLGSSSAAIVAGLSAAWGLAYPEQPVDRSWLLEAAASLEGHVDNVAPAIFGEFALTWMEDAKRARAVSLPVHSQIQALALVPSVKLMTSRAREALPPRVPFADAKANLSAAALLVHAVQHDPRLLWAATKDYLHQDYRRELYPDSYDLMQQLRHQGFAACISGAGPTLLVLLERSQVPDLEAALSQESLAAAVTSFQKRLLSPGSGVELQVLSY